MNDLVAWSHMSIDELKQELEQLKKNAFLLGKENSFIWSFKISFLEAYIIKRIKEREELIPR